MRGPARMKDAGQKRRCSRLGSESSPQDHCHEQWLPSRLPAPPTHRRKTIQGRRKRLNEALAQALEQGISVMPRLLSSSTTWSKSFVDLDKRSIDTQ